MELKRYEKEKLCGDSAKHLLNLFKSKGYVIEIYEGEALEKDYDCVYIDEIKNGENSNYVYVKLFKENN